MKNTILVSLLFLLMSANTLIAQDNAYHLYQTARVVCPEKNIKETWFPLPECTDNTHTAHIIAYARGLMSIIKAGAYATTNPDLYAYSPYSIHNYLRKNCTDDINIHEGLGIVKMHGIALEKDFPAMGNCAVKPDASAGKAAAENRIKDHICIFDKNTTPEDKVLNVQKQLCENHNPVIVQLTVKQNNKHIPAGTHTVCIVGYSSSGGTLELVASNSKAWTDSGYLSLSYEDFGKMASVGYVMAPAEGMLPPIDEELLVVDVNEPTPKVHPVPSPGKTDHVEELRPEQPIAQHTVNLHGTFEFRFLKQHDEYTGKPVFASANPVLQNNSYILPDWNAGDVYQLLGTTMKAYSYTYVFSVDAKGKTEVHFPPLINMALYPDTHLNEPHQDLMTANKIPLKPTIVPDEAAYMVIPDEESALQSVHEGKDYICVIYSHHQLHDITERIVRVHEASQQDFQQRLNEGFGDILIPNEDIRYTDGLMSFEAISSSGTAVPLVLEVQVN